MVEAVRQAALAHGFARVGFTPVEPLGRAALAAEWLAAGRHGEMSWLGDAAQRDQPALLLQNARTLITVVASYHFPRVPGADEVDEVASVAGQGQVARYAQGADYHVVLKRHLRALAEEIGETVGRPVAFRACVDTAPLFERDAAARAGVGFIAKNTLLISPGLGSYTLLGELVIDVDLLGEAGVESPPVESSRCGECRACLDACPTGALTAAWMMDARLCISYLTIELKGPIPRALRPLVGTHIFGCDICQDVCPFNQHHPRSPMPDLVPLERLRAPRLVDLLSIGSAQYRRLVEGTALRRARRSQLLRNVAVAIGNAGDGQAVPVLARSLELEREPLVRGHVAWALGRLGGVAARAALERARRQEADAFVREEIELSLAELH
jgi:epoxyqueuosine reductase